LLAAGKPDPPIGLILSVAAIGATALLMLPTLNLPLHPDQALFAVVGRTVAAGGFPYRDAWDFKLPGLYLLYAAANHGPLDVAHNVRLFNLIWTAASAGLIAELGRRWWNWRAGLIAALIYALVCSTDIPFWLSAQPDSLAVLPLVLSLLLYDVARGRPLVLIASGLMLGAAFQLRATTLLLAPVYPLVELAESLPRTRVRLWVQRLFWLAGGFVIVQAAMLAYLAAGRALEDFVATMQYVSGYTRTGGAWNPSTGPTLPAYWGVLRQAFWNWTQPRIFLVLPGLAAGIAGTAMGNRRVLQLLLFAGLCYAGVAVQLKFFWYHYDYMVPFLALLGGWGWDQVWTAMRRRGAAIAGLVTVGAAAAVLLLGSSQFWDSGIAAWKSYFAYRRNPAEWHRTAPELSGLRDEQIVADYIRHRTSPDDRMYVWGFDPVLYLLAGRPLGSRFVLSYPLMSRWSTARWQPTFIEELQRDRPVYIVLHPDEPESWITGEDIEAIAYVDRFPAFRDLLASDYERETVLSGRILYRHKTP
jgi:hypothetical protein